MTTSAGKVDDAVGFGACEDCSSAVYGTTDHFVLVVGNGFGSLGVQAYSDTGAALNGLAVRPDFGNEVDVIAVGVSGDIWILRQAGGSSSQPVRLEHYDPTMALVGSTAAVSSADSLLAIGLSRTGDALIAWRAGGTARAKWFGPTAEARSPDFEIALGSDATGLSTATLADGSVTLSATHSDNSTALFGVVADASASPQAPADWLKDRGGAHFALIRGGEAYAFWPSTPECSGLEIVALDGTSCGCVAVPDVGDRSNIGADGSLLVPYTHEDGGTYQVGTYWYPALLK